MFLDETIKVDAVWMHPPHSDARRAEVAVRRRALATPLEGSIAVTDQIAGLSMQPVAWLRAAFSDRDLEVEVGHASGCCAIDAPDALAVRMDVGWDDDLSRWAHSTGDRNLWGVQDPVADRLVDAMHTGPREDQVRAGRALHRHLMESGRFMPLWHVDQKVWISPRLPPDVPIVPRDAWTLVHTWTWATP